MEANENEVIQMILKLQPVYFDKVWGGNAFRRLYGYPTGDSCGEAWGISAHPHGSSTVMNGPYRGKTLRALFDQEAHLFGNYHGDRFPILVKVISARTDLSIQVHPNDEYASQFDSLGKEECWFILDADNNTEILIGHDATSKDELRQAIFNHTITDLMRRHPIQAGDFFYIEAGTIHAICGGTTLLEVQQSSDITYRVYDYNRLHNGSLRELHVEHALDVINVPDKPLRTTHNNRYFHYNFFDNDAKTPHQADRHGDYIFVLDGTGRFDDVDVKAGDFIMVSANATYETEGQFRYQLTTF